MDLFAVSVWTLFRAENPQSQTPLYATSLEWNVISQIECLFQKEFI